MTEQPTTGPGEEPTEHPDSPPQAPDRLEDEEPSDPELPDILKTGTA